MSDLSQTGCAIDGQLGLYEQQADAWKVDHARATGCLDLEAVLGLGLHIYQIIRRADQTWSESVRTGAVALRREDAQQFSKWYSWWIKPGETLLEEIKGFEAEGFEVNGSKEFREAWLQVRAALANSLDRVMGAADDVSPVKPMSEVRDAVRRRLEAIR